MERTLILKRFKEIGLKPSEAKTYLSLLQRDTLTVSEVAKLAGIPRANAYHALEELMVKGMCVAKPGETKKYSASDPSILVEKFHIQADEDAKRHLQDLTEKEKGVLEKNKVTKENISALLQELRPEYQRSRLETNPMDYIEIIKDPYQIHKRFMQLAAEAREEILVFTKQPYSVPREQLEEQIDQETHVLKKGIRGRSIYEIPSEGEQKRWLLEIIKRAVTAGEEARVLDELPMKMAIFDSRIVIYVLEDPVSKQPSVTTQIVEHRTLAKSLKILFETFWQRAEDHRILTT
jgi:sugar-specific transcriptional regulator TrmB